MQPTSSSIQLLVLFDYHLSTNHNNSKTPDADTRLRPIEHNSSLMPRDPSACEAVHHSPNTVRYV